MGVKEAPQTGKGQSIIMDMAKTIRFKDDSPIGIVLNYATHSLYYMAMWKKDTHIGMMENNDNVEEYIVQNNIVEDLNIFLNEVCDVDITVAVRGDRLVITREKGELPFSSGASRGTLIMCRMYTWLRRSRERDALMFSDDFDDMFDYRTAEKAIRWIISQVKAQCIFVTHNTGLASNDFLRPDCCFILDNGQLGSFSSLTDKDIRRGHNLEKMLREGEFDRTVN